MDPENQNPTPPVTTPAPTDNQPPTPPATPPVGSETPPTPPTETSTPPAPATPPIDVEAIKKELTENITGTVQKEVAEKIAKALGLTKEQEEQLPTDPKALLELVKSEATKATQAILDEQHTTDAKVAADRAKNIEAGAASFVKLWDGQYDQLAESGKVPKIALPATDPNYMNDPGYLAKQRILGKLKEIVLQNEMDGVDYVPTLKEVFYENPNIINIETKTGANVPVSGGGRVTTPNQGLSYEQLHNTPVEELVARKHES